MQEPLNPLHFLTSCFQHRAAVFGTIRCPSHPTRCALPSHCIPLEGPLSGLFAFNLTTNHNLSFQTRWSARQWLASVKDYWLCKVPAAQETMPRKQRLKQRERKDSEGVSGCSKGLLDWTAVSGIMKSLCRNLMSRDPGKYPLTGHRPLDTARVFSPIREIIVSVNGQFRYFSMVN